MTYQLTARDFAGGATGGQHQIEQDGKYGMIGYCICGWVGPIRTAGGYNRVRSQTLRDYDKHVSTCDVANHRKPAPDWGYIEHKAKAENEVVHSHRSWRAKCACGWEGQLFWEDGAEFAADTEAKLHTYGRKPVHIGGRIL